MPTRPPVWGPLGEMLYPHTVNLIISLGGFEKNLDIDIDSGYICP